LNFQLPCHGIISINYLKGEIVLIVVVVVVQVQHMPTDISCEWFHTLGGRRRPHNEAMYIL